MNKNEQTRIKREVAKLLKEKDNYKKLDDVLIGELIMWLEISDFNKTTLMSDPTNWQALTTAAMASKQIQSILTKLNITPQERVRKTKGDENKKSEFDLNKFLNEN